MKDNTLIYKIVIAFLTAMCSVSGIGYINLSTSEGEVIMPKDVYVEVRSINEKIDDLETQVGKNNELIKAIWLNQHGDVTDEELLKQLLSAK